jgi:hypothetical protein
MNKDSVSSLIGGLMADRGQVEGEESTRAATEKGPADAEQPPPSAIKAPPADRETAPSRKTASFAAAESLSSRPVTLTQAEIAFAAEVATGLRTPRTVKKFTNLYRLLRAGLDEGQLNSFLAGRGSEATEYQAVLILLAAIIGRPEDASSFLLALLTKIDSDTTWQGLLLSSGIYGVGKNMRDFLASITPMGYDYDKWLCAPFKRWAPEVSRFSFTTGQEVFARVGAEHLEEA